MDSLQSEAAFNLYKKIGDNSLSKLTYLERALNGRKRNLTITEGNRIFIIMGDVIQYDDYLFQRNDGNYLGIHLEKEIPSKKVRITLNRGISGFDLLTGERYDRKLSEVSYTYDGTNIEDLVTKDETDLETEEELRQLEAHHMVEEYVKGKRSSG